MAYLKASRIKEKPRIPEILSMDHELFASLVASGMSLPKAAEEAGFAKDYGVALAKVPKVAERIQELIEVRMAQPPDEIVSKPWIEAQLVTIVRKCLSDKKPDYACAGLNLMRLAQLRGYVVTRSASIDA